MSEDKKIIDVVEIMEKIPHRYPMLLVDRIHEIHEKGCTGIKNVTINESIFQGHFPGAPVFPGVLTIEAMAQTAGAFVMYEMGGKSENKLVYFMSIDEVKFRKTIVPGDRVSLEVIKIKQRGNVWKFQGYAKVEGQVCAQAVFSAMIIDKSGK